MEKLLYRRIDNPLNNKRFVKDVLYEYIFNDSLFNALFVNKKKRNNQSITFHDILFKSNYDDWKKKIDKLYESLTDDDSKAEDIRILHEFLNNYHVKNFKDVSLVLSEGNKSLKELFNKYCPISFGSDGFTTINSFGEKKFDYGLCISCDSSKLHLIVYKFYEKCKNNNLNYCIKFNESGLRKDSIIIKCNYDDLAKYINILEEVINENDLNSDLNDLPLCIGEISNKIGYVSGKDDFFTRRTKHIEKCVEQETINWMNSYLDKNIETSTGRSVPYKYFVFNKIVMEKKHKLLNDLLCEIDVDDINSRSFSKIATDLLLRNYVDICNAVFYKDTTYKLIVPYKKSSIEFTYNDFKNIFKDQANFFKDKPGFEEAILYRIKNTCIGWDIDPTNYGMDIGDSYLLGNDISVPKKRVTIDILNNFDDSNKKIKSSREGCILDSNIKKRSIFGKKKNKK